jgi:MacB-like periplasmic core domain
MNAFGQEILHSLRMLRRNPGFTLVAVLTLAIGIGTNATVFRWVDAILLHPLSGVQDPDRLVSLETTTPGGDFVTNSYPDYIDFRDNLKLVEVAMSRPAAFSVGPQDHAERVWGELVTGNFFAVLGAKAQLGRVFLPAEYGDKPGGYPIAVVSDRYWRSHLQADPSIVGKTIRVNKHELTIVGVAAPGFHGSLAPAQRRRRVDAARPQGPQHAWHRPPPARRNARAGAAGSPRSGRPHGRRRR